jgi:hypothetical protein
MVQRLVPKAAADASQVRATLLKGLVLLNSSHLFGSVFLKPIYIFGLNFLLI